MKTVFVDANVFLRFFTQDEAGQREKAATLFRSASAGALALVTGPPVLFEVAWTLRAAYRLSNIQTLDALSAIAGLPGLRLLDGAAAEEAISLARATGQEFADAYIATTAKQAGASEIATFNRKHFERLACSLYEW